MCLSATMITSQLRAVSSLIIGMQRVACPRPQSSGATNTLGLEIPLLKILPIIKTMQ